MSPEEEIIIIGGGGSRPRATSTDDAWEVSDYERARALIDYAEQNGLPILFQKRQA